MPIASGSRVGVSYVAEATAGTTPGIPSMKTFRATTRNLNLSKNNIQSAEVRPDRMRRSSRHGFKSAQGTLGAEIAPNDHDDFLEAALSGAWTTDVLQIGTNLRTFSIERRFTDIAQYQAFAGCAINSMRMQMQPDSMATIEFGIVGMSGGGFSATSLGTPAAAVDDEPFTALDGSLSIDGTPISVVTGIDFELNNNRSVQGVVGADTSPGVFEGEAILTGNMTAFFEDAGLVNNFVNETDIAMQVVLQNAAGTKSHTWAFHKLKVNGGDIDPPTSGPITLSMPFEAIYSAGDGNLLTLTRSYA